MVGSNGPVIAVFLSEHGFGHAVRSTWLLAELQRRQPRARLHLATRLPAWLYRELGDHQRVEHLALPSPLVQSDSLAVDHERSTALLRETLRDWDRQVDAIHHWLVQVGADLVYCDVPAQPLVAAERAGVPALALGNFTWDWIYRHYADHDQAYAEAAERMAQAYRKARLYLRLPASHEPPAGMRCQDLAWLVRTPSRPREHTRAALGLGAHESMVLLSFGGHPGLPLSVLIDDELCRRHRLMGGRHLASASGGLVEALDEDQLAAQGMGYADLVHAADVVVSKPGYGVIADCLSCQSRLIYLARPEFPEADLLVAPMKEQLGAIEVPAEQFTARGIAAAIDAALQRPRPTPTAALDGLRQAADALEALLP